MSEMTADQKFNLEKMKLKHMQNMEYVERMIFPLVKWITFVSSIIAGFPQIASTIERLMTQ